MNKLKTAIPNYTFSVDERSKINKKMTDLGITSEHYEALLKIDFGKYLRGVTDATSVDMINPHAL
ncbi:hypothetical protein COE15_18420 [Bacillus cereus]|uniref:hypothetical protein n=1 Tax=Bacillus sp. AFS023182 TaxID=2033492 RepID=UPI000BF99EBC|nr:hypothetical protein [Bacillus sp. AFS023182]PFE01239.1 hypothetical protein CN288_16420 [Bacillus sp. AFS023182]PGX96731.1 hypothetical protein COE15_18420 [Bacillus cereus]